MFLKQNFSDLIFCKTFFPQTCSPCIQSSELRMNCKAESLAGIQSSVKGTSAEQMLTATGVWNQTPSRTTLLSSYSPHHGAPSQPSQPPEIQHSFPAQFSLWSIWKLCTQDSHQMTPIKRSPLRGEAFASFLNLVTQRVCSHPVNQQTGLL